MNWEWMAIAIPAICALMVLLGILYFYALIISAIQSISNLDSRLREIKEAIEKRNASQNFNF
jgi:hypothetical protein